MWGLASCDSVEFSVSSIEHINKADYEQCQCHIIVVQRLLR